MTRVRAGTSEVALWQVDDLERYVDRRALLGAGDAPEPPYWAHCWSGARVLAAAVPAGPATAVELGCGLGLPGLVAALRGARVTFVDREPVPLAFVQASAAANGLAPPPCVAADVTSDAVAGRFDLVLAAELLYDRTLFTPIATAIANRLAPNGTALLTDANRVDTTTFWPILATKGLTATFETHQVEEEGFPLTIRLATIRHA